MSRDLERAVVITALRPDQAAGCLRVTGQAGWVLPLETGSAIVVNDVGAAMGAASAASSLQRKRTVAVLWRDDLYLAEWPDDEPDELQRGSECGPAAGLTLARRGRLVSGHVWEGPYVRERLEAEQFDGAAAITKALDVSTGTHLLRAVLRRTGVPMVLLGEAVELLGLPSALLGLLDDESMPEAAEVVEADPEGRNSFRSFLRLVHSNLPRWWAIAGWLVPALVALQFAIRLLLAVLDKSGGRTDDIVGFLVLGLVAGSFSAWWFWFSRRLYR